MEESTVFHDTHDHTHHHFVADTLRNRKRLKIILSITLGFMFVEYIGGYISNSVALMSDATHMLADVTALSLTLGSFYLSTIPPNENNTFGLKRIEVLVGFVNGLFLLFLAGTILWASTQRFFSPPDVKGLHMVSIAVLGLLINLIAGVILIKGNQQNFALRSAFLHIVGDAISSVGAIIAGILVYFYNLKLADPIAGWIVGCIIAFSAVRLIKDSGHIILQGVPHNQDIEKIHQTILNISSVQSIHDLHLWSLNSGQSILTVHVIVANLDQYHEVLAEVRQALLKEHNIEHSTVQLEISEGTCEIDCNHTS